MSKPLTTHTIVPDGFGISQGTEVKERMFLLEGFTGVYRDRPAMLLPNTALANGVNAGFTQSGFYDSFPGHTGVSSTTSGVDIVEVYSLHTKTETKVFIATTTGIRLGYVASSTIRNITALSGPTLTLSVGDRVTFVVWNETYLLMTSQSTGLIAIDMTAGTYAVVSEAPVGAGHVGKMNGRVVLSDFIDNPRRTQWCAKFDYTDWSSSSLGVGFEDLPATYGENRVFGVYEFSDTTGIVIRQNSIDIVESTDNFDVPFRFSKRFSDILVYRPRTIVQTPDSIIVAGVAQVYEIRLDGVEQIASPLALSVSEFNTTPFAFYIPRYDMYLIYNIANDDTYGGFAYWRKYKAWTVVSPAVANTYMVCGCSCAGPATTAYSGLGGTYEGLTGTLDTLGTQTNTYNSFLVATSDDMYLYANSGVQCPFLEFPTLEPTNPLNKITLVSISLVGTFTTTNSFSINTGEYTTSEYARITPVVSIKPQTFFFQKTVSGRRMRITFSGLTNSTGDIVGAIIRPHYVLVRYTEGPAEFSGTPV